MTKKRGPKGRGSIFKEGKRYRAQITLDGRKINFSAKTRAECQAWIDEMIKRKNSGLTYHASKKTVPQFFGEWLPIHSKKLRDQGHQYNQLSRDYIIPYFENKKLMDLKLHAINQFYDQLSAKGNSAQTIRHIHSVFHVGMEYALRNGWISRNPCEGAILPRTDKDKEMKFLNEEQVYQFLQACKGHRLETLYNLAVTLGARRGELQGLKWKDVNWEARKLNIFRQLKYISGKGYNFSPPKTKSGKRTISLSQLNLIALESHRIKMQAEYAAVGQELTEDELVFPSEKLLPMNESVVRMNFKRILKKAGLPEIRFHDLRHTAASLMLNQGIPLYIVSRILGHSKPSVTIDMYGHLIEEKLDLAAEMIDKLFMPIEVDLDFGPNTPE